MPEAEYYGGYLGDPAHLGASEPPRLVQPAIELSHVIGFLTRRISWNILFFSAAVVTTSAAAIGVLGEILQMPRVPFTLFAETFLLFFGLFMLVVDVPVLQPSNRLIGIRTYAFKFLLFTTRFTGRGIWYCFLGAMILASLWDSNTSPFLGLVLGGYVITIGFVAFVSGLSLSCRLEEIRELLQAQRRVGPPPDFVWTKEQFAQLASECGEAFTDAELSHVLNGLALTPASNGTLSNEEMPPLQRKRPGRNPK